MLPLVLALRKQRQVSLSEFKAISLVSPRKARAVERERERERHCSMRSVDVRGQVSGVGFASTFEWAPGIELRL